jgi:hypothetical protein
MVCLSVRTIRLRNYLHLRLGLSGDLFLSAFPTSMLCACLIFPMHTLHASSTSVNMIWTNSMEQSPS